MIAIDRIQKRFLRSEIHFFRIGCRMELAKATAEPGYLGDVPEMHHHGKKLK